jgi:serine/threonine protein kinase
MYVCVCVCVCVTWRGRECAIKELNTASMQGAREFLKEVNVLSMFQHPNLLPLVGFCISREGSSSFCALIYQRMQGSLEDALLQSRGAPIGGNQALSASDRLLIAVDAASGLEYLHALDNKPVVLHWDIKSSNVLLDAEKRARISDVRLAQYADQMAGSLCQKSMIGKFGYIDGTYMATGMYTPASDVFSFGVVLLELLTGEQATDATKVPPHLHARAGAVLPDGAAAVADPVAGWSAAVAECFARVAKECICDQAAERPTSRAVVDRLTALGAQEVPVQQVEEQVRTCIICMDAPRRTRLRPCCHVVFCEECAAEYTRRNRHCPVCRQNVLRFDVGDFRATYEPVHAVN